MNARGQVRTADAKEASAWVSYCNEPDHRDRKAHGHAAPLNVRHWQIGNETSYDKNGFDLEIAARKTVEFAKSMRAADPEWKTKRHVFMGMDVSVKDGGCQVEYENQDPRIPR